MAKNVKKPVVVSRYFVWSLNAAVCLGYRDRRLIWLMPVAVYEFLHEFCTSRRLSC
jgi:hypothetical protein